MTESQEHHLKELLTISHALLSEKYRRGAAEHGGDLQSMTVSQLLDNAIDENIDQLTYLLTAKANLSNVKTRYNPVGVSDLPRVDGKDVPIPTTPVRSVRDIPAK